MASHSRLTLTQESSSHPASGEATLLELTSSRCPTVCALPSTQPVFNGNASTECAHCESETHVVQDQQLTVLKPLHRSIAH
eukprot:554867-Amphidinium_carterae.1